MALFSVLDATFEALSIFEDVVTRDKGIVPPRAKVGISIAIDINAKAFPLLSEGADFAIVGVVVVIVLFDQVYLILEFNQE